MGKNVYISIVLSILLVLFQLGDIFLTEKILKSGGKELNPLISRYGYWIKIPVVTFAVVAGILVHQVILIPVVIISAGVCVWNWIVYRKIK